MKKSPATPKEKPDKPGKPRTATHPPYFQMIKEALISLKDKNGSSSYAISKKIEEKYKSLLPENFRQKLSLQLKNSVSKDKLVKIRASYKLIENITMRTTRQNKIKNLKKEETETKKTRSSTMSVNKPEVTTKKKMKVNKPRQPKSIKSPVTRKVLRASAT